MGKFDRNAPCWCGSGKKYKACHMNMDNKIHTYELQGHIVPRHDILKNAHDIQKIKESSVINMAVLDAVGAMIGPGVSTQEIDDVVSSVTTKMGGIAAPLNYEGYPKSVCTSINEVVCHGIPDPNVILKEGDIVNVDVSTILDGYFSDSSRMYMIGEISPEKRKLVEVTKECCDLGLTMVKPWNFLGDMADVIHRHALENGFNVVIDIGGHGVGFEFHEEPFVSYVTKPGTEMLMVPGMVFTIEPMINMGTAAVTIDKKDGWTVRTADGKPSAQWEYTVAVTEDGYEILTW
ncbi:MAG: methionyl aminopeptidase [Lachnospiraceae bacterium]|nr:methionyl aminopeptidase [Lachnospiraceae bacterium]